MGVAPRDVCANLHDAAAAPARDQTLENKRVSGSDGNGRSGDEPPGRMQVCQDAEADPTGGESPPVPPGHAYLVDHTLARLLGSMQRDLRLGFRRISHVHQSLHFPSRKLKSRLSYRESQEAGIAASSCRDDPSLLSPQRPMALP